MAGGLWLETLREASRFRYRAPSRITTARDPSPLEEAGECMPNSHSYVKDYFQSQVSAAFCPPLDGEGGHAFGVAGWGARLARWYFLPPP